MGSHKDSRELQRRVLLLVSSRPATKFDSERRALDVEKRNRTLVKARVMLTGEGLQPTSKGARIRFTGVKPTVTDGPSTESN